MRAVVEDELGAVEEDVEFSKAGVGGGRKS